MGESGPGTMKEHSMFLQLTKTLLRIKQYKKRKYHSERVKRPGVHKDQSEVFDSTLEGKQKEKFNRRKFSLRNVAGEKRILTKSCPDLDTTYDDIYGTPHREVDAVDFNTLKLFRNLSVGEVETIEIHFEN